MIAALLLRFGIPKWAAIAALCALAAAGALGYRHHLIQQGVSLESARRDAIDAENDRRAQAALATLNARVKAAQEQLAAAIARVDQLKSDLDHEKTVSSDRQRDLLAGTERLRILARARPLDPAGSPTGSSASTVDSGAEIVVDIAGPVAADIDRIRSERNQVIERLDACIAAYDAVKTASDAQ